MSFSSQDVNIAPILIDFKPPAEFGVDPERVAVAARRRERILNVAAALALTSPLCVASASIGVEIGCREKVDIPRQVCRVNEVFRDASAALLGELLAIGKPEDPILPLPQ